MLTLGPLAFTAPWLLLALAALPILWLLLRAIPPAPIRRRFPGVTLLLGLTDDETQSDRTPWWLLLIRTLAVAAAIIGLAGPVLNPKPETSGNAPLLILIDGTWAEAPTWAARLDRARAALREAATEGRETALAVLTAPTPEGPVFRPAEAQLSGLAALSPAAWPPRAADAEALADSLPAAVDTLWLSDGLDHPGRAALLADLDRRGTVTVFQSPRPTLALAPAVFDDGAIRLTAIRDRADTLDSATIAAIGPDPSGVVRQLATAEARFAPSETTAEVALALPPEIRNRITRFEIAGTPSAGAVTMTDDALARREVALITPASDREGLQLLAPDHYLRQALAPNADLIDGDLGDVIPANPDVIILADVVAVTETERAALLDWIDGGGLLLRFAGPRLAASDIGRDTEDSLLPVRLRAGGRQVGGAMSWGEPKALRAFQPGSPFFGLDLPGEVAVRAQVMAQPDPTLAERTIAALEDGTPLVTRKRHGSGQIVLVHTTANAEWSSLPLSGLFVAMLERLAVSSRAGGDGDVDLTGTVWTADAILMGDGEVVSAEDRAGVPGEAIAARDLGPDLPPGLYSGEDRRIAVNVVAQGDTLTPFDWPAGIAVEGLDRASELPLQGALLTLALTLLALDILASLALTGRLTRLAGTAAAVLLAAVLLPQHGQAQTPPPDAEIAAAAEVTLAHVLTGNASVDRTSEAGLAGLGRVLFSRTSIEPAAPRGIDLEVDELSLYPFLYWPITPDQPRPSDEAYEKINRYLRSGGMILFDTRDADAARFGASSPNGRKLQDLALPLDIPPLEPIPEDHVLTRTFYLLQDFPGRFSSRDVWVEAAPPGAERAEGMPFRNLNDNVTPVVVGGNDWAAAWALDEDGRALYQVGRGFAGERQREIAWRFGVNLIMHVLTGNYKSDQVHVPALLDRLGQ